MRTITILLFFVFPIIAQSQSLADDIQQLNAQLEATQLEVEQLKSQIEGKKLLQIQEDLQALGLPKLEMGETPIFHSAMALIYNEQHEQAKWVAHIIRPEIITGRVARTNTFMIDPLVETGTAEEKDYFLTTSIGDSIVYDGFGFDRGHLAASADFRWSQKALAESYFYSNIAPQRPGFNRGIWAKLENALRGYLFRNPETQLYVVTGPVLQKDLPKSPRSTNEVSVPAYFWKVAVDLKNKQGIGFIIPNQKSDYEVSHFARSIDEVEQQIGLDLFPALMDDVENSLERTVNPSVWLPKANPANVDPLLPTQLKSGQINTRIAKKWIGNDRKISVCGTVVGTRTSRKGNILLNLDKQFPNQVFTVFIRKEHIVNFPYDPEPTLINQSICTHGKVIGLSGLPAMYLQDAKALEIRNEP